MSLEELNNEYLRLNAATKKYKTNLEKYEKDLETAEKDLETAENNLKSATTKTDKKKYQTEVNTLKTEINDIKIQIELAKKQQQVNQGEIDKIISQVKEMPEVKEQCSRAIDVKTERQIKKFEKQKKEQEEKKTTLEQLKNMIAKHPQATIIVNTIENKSFEISKKDSEIKEVDSKIAKLDPSNPNYATDKAMLDADKTKLEGERKTLVSERQTQRNNLKKLFNNQKLNGEIDNLTTRDALDKNYKNCDRLIRRSENKIHDYTYAKESLYGKNTTSPTPTAPTPVGTATPSKWETFKGLFGKRAPGDVSRWEAFKSLFKKKQALPAPAPTSTPNSTVQSFKDEIKINGDVMKNEVVQAIYKETLDKKVEEGKSER